MKVNELIECYEKQIADLKAQIPQWLTIDENTPLNVDILVEYDDGSFEFFKAEENDGFWEKYDGENKNHIGVYSPVRYMLPTPPENEA